MPTRWQKQTADHVIANSPTEVNVGNMSYCRFKNTLDDLQDCYENIDSTDLSPSEARARKKLVKLCADIASDCEDEFEDD